MFLPHPRLLQFALFLCAGIRLGALAVVLLMGSLCATAPTAIESCTIAELRSRPGWLLKRHNPLCVEGTVTMVDPERNLLVLQDQTGPLAFELGDTKISAQVGMRLRLEAQEAWPFDANISRYPDRPDREEVLSAFNWDHPLDGGFFLSRYRCLLLAPETGSYRFYLASDDSSVLLLGTSDLPESVRSIARVSTYTKPGDWLRYPEQCSGEIELEAGKPYYLEVLHQQSGGASHFGLAWSGPGFSITTLSQPHIKVFGAGQQRGSVAGTGVLRETWLHVPVVQAASLVDSRKLGSVLSVRGVSIHHLETSSLPTPLLLRPGQELAEERNFIWAEVEGTVEFVGSKGNHVVLELTDAGQSLEVIGPMWTQSDPQTLRGRRIRVVGVAEAVWSHERPQIFGKIWLRPKDGLVVTDHAPSADVARLIEISDLYRSDVLIPRDTAVKFKGRVTKQQGNVITISDEGVFHAFLSRDSANWFPVGRPLTSEMPWHVYAGFAVASGTSQQSSKAVFSDIDGFQGVFRLLDIGGSTLNGKMEISAGKLSIEGVGTDIWNTPDQFSFVYVPVDGPFTFTSRIDSLEDSGLGSKAGLMVRDSLSADAQWVDLVTWMESGMRLASLQWRWGHEGSTTRHSDLYPQGNEPVWLRLERRYSSVEVSSKNMGLFEKGEPVSVVGYASIDDGRPSISGAAISRPPREREPQSFYQDWRPLVELASVCDGHGTWGGYDVFRVRGIVTFCGEVLGRRYWTIQDRSGAALLKPRSPSDLFDVAPGQMVEIHSNPGWNPPSTVLYADNVLTLGQGAMPTPIRHPGEYLLPRRGEGTWIELDGVVRSFGDSRTLQVKSRGELFSVSVLGAQTELLERLVDAEVRVRGVIVYPSEGERLLLVPSSAFLDVLLPPHPDPFGGPLLEFQAAGPKVGGSQLRHKVLIGGNITYANSEIVYLQNEGGSARLEFEKGADLTPGDAVLATGYLDSGPDLCYVLRNAEYRRADKLRVPVPVELTEETLAGNDTLFRLVRCEGIVLRTWSPEGGGPLELDVQGRPIEVLFPPKTIPSRTLPVGSVISVTGVLERGGGGLASHPSQARVSSLDMLRILAQDGADLVVLATPSWWVLRRTLIIASLAALGAFILVVWIQLLRYRVRQRTQELAVTMDKLHKEATRSATLAERDRLAGEIHDSLEQGLNGIIFQLECTSSLASCSQEVRQALQLACNMASFSRTEVQYAVWELQSPMLEDSDLLTAIEKIAHQIGDGFLSTSVRLEGSPKGLPSGVEHHLLRVVQEALNNIVKHAKATQAEVLICYKTESLELRVSDNGCGFEPAAVRIGGLGHFGLRSLKSRVARIEGTLSVKSAPGAGTVISVQVPVAKN